MAAKSKRAKVLGTARKEMLVWLLTQPFGPWVYKLINLAIANPNRLFSRNEIAELAEGRLGAVDYLQSILSKRRGKVGLRSVKNAPTCETYTFPHYQFVLVQRLEKPETIPTYPPAVYRPGSD